MNKNDSRIPVVFSLTSICAASFAAFKGKVLEACGLSFRKNVQFFYDPGKNDGPSESAKLCYPAALVARGACLHC